MGFLGRIIKPLVENAFDRLQSEAMQERLKEQDKKASKILSLFPIQELFNFGPMANITAIVRGPQAAAQAELGRTVETFFAPFLADASAFTGGVRNLFEPFYYTNRFGGMVGGAVGGGAGFLLGFILPGGPLIWSSIFGWVGEHVGTFIQGALSAEIIHPDVPGSPGEIFPDDPFGDLPQHVQDIMRDALANATPYVSNPLSVRSVPPIRTRIRGRRII